MRDGLENREFCLQTFLETAEYQNAAETVRDTLRGHLIDLFGGDWEKIHREFGIYTINCRVKSVPRTLEKFGKVCGNDPAVAASHFYERLPDLAAGRLVVVDPGDLFKVAEIVRLQSVSPFFECAGPHFKARRVRHGKISMYDTERFRSQGYEIEEEGTGYCSVHFVFRTGQNFFFKCGSEDLVSLRRLGERGKIPMTEWRVEIQVRTLMDEAWGETDHFVRYERPDVRDNPVITNHFSALAAYLQAANHHVALIRAMTKENQGL